MTKLFYSPPSPYSAKVRMAAAHAGIALDAVIVETAKDPADLLAANPLGKIPAIMEDDGTCVFDSPVILQHFNRVAKNTLYPRSAAKRLEAEQMEALCDGIADCLLAAVYERRFRPEEKLHQPWIDRQMEKAFRGLDALCAQRLGPPVKIHAGHIALRSLIGYLDLRFAGQWERKRAKLKRFAAKFDANHPQLAALIPSA